MLKCRNQLHLVLKESALTAVCERGAYANHTAPTSSSSTSTSSSSSLSSTTTSRTTTTSTTTSTSSTTHSTATECSVYVLLDPDIVDVSSEGANVKAALLPLTASLTIWSETAEMMDALTSGTVEWGATILIAEQERASLLSKIDARDVASIKCAVSSQGLNLLVVGSQLGPWDLRDAELINAVTNWTVSGPGDSSSCDIEPQVPLTLAGGGFATGPSQLPYTSFVYCHEEDSLPNGTDGLYASNARAFSWTAPFGIGRVTFFGHDSFNPDRVWYELQKSSLDAACKNVSSVEFTSHRS
eukprot:4805084-Amphidinium_carterae.2